MVDLILYAIGCFCAWILGANHGYRRAASMTTEPVRDADTAIALRAQILEYEHALEHVIDCGSCEQCTRLAQSALDGISRKDFLDAINWHDEAAHIDGPGCGSAGAQDPTGPHPEVPT